MWRYRTRIPEPQLSENDYSRSRKFFVIEGSFAMGITTMSSGVVISGILKYLGATDAVNGIISGIPVCVGVLLIFMPLIIRKLKKLKTVVTIFAVAHRLLFSLMLSIPLIIKDDSVRLFTFVVIFALAYILGTMIGPSASNWLVSLVPARIRGRYLGMREGIMIAVFAVVSVTIGIIIDNMKAAGNEAMGYAICTIIIFVFTVGNLICLLNIKEPPLMPPKNKITMKTIITTPFKDKNFRKILILSMIWNFSLQIGGPYFSIYYYSVLGLNYTYILTLSVAMYLCRVLAAQYWGRLADKLNWVVVTKLAFIVLGIAHGGYFFMNELSYKFIFPVLQVLSGIGWGGIAIAIFNLQFEYAPEELRNTYVSVNTAVGSAFGFSAILIGAAVVNKIGGTVSYLGKMPIHGIQFLLLTSGVMILLTSLYVHKVIKPHKAE